jgi:hypothetical protein
MKYLFLLSLSWMLAGCAMPRSGVSDPRDYAVTTCETSPQEIAVQADAVFPSEVADLWVKLGRSQTSSSVYLQRRGQSFKLFCVLLVDRSTLLPQTT